MTAHATVRSTQIGPSPTLICAANPRRQAVVFSPPLGAAEYTVSTDPNVALAAGLNLASGGPMVEVTLPVFGDAVTRAWYGVAAASLTIGFVETVTD